MKFRSLNDITEHNNHMKNRVYEILAVWANDIPLSKQAALQRFLQEKILDVRNFFPTDFVGTVELYNQTCCPDLSEEFQQILFVSTQSRNVVSSFFHLPQEEDEELWIEERMRLAKELCEGMYPTMPKILVYKDLSPYTPYVFKNMKFL